MAGKSRASTQKNRKKQSLNGNELLVTELQQIHSAEKQLTAAVPRLAKAIESEDLRNLVNLRQDQGERLMNEIEDALDEMDESPGRKKNLAAEGLINDLREHLQEIEAGNALDAVIIAGLQKIEHYCIAAWGTSRSLGFSLNQKRVVKTMEKALDEGRNLDGELTNLAERRILPNILGASPEFSEGKEEMEDESQENNGGSLSGERSRREEHNRARS